jgi:DNA polymerase III delta prime subunit
MAVDLKAKKYLDRLAGSKSRPSYYIFTGQDEEEKEAAAFYFVSKIAGKAGDEEFFERLVSKIHPDVLIIEPEIEEKKGRTREKEISISQVREALERLKFFPYELEQKFCIVKKAQKMNQEAANALLKSLEESSEKTIFILLARDADSVLPTIASRCALLRFPEKELPQWNEENRKKMREIMTAEIFERFDYIEKISKDRKEFSGILKDWELVMAETLRKLVGAREDGRKIRKVVELIENVQKAINRLEGTNAGARGVGEEFVLGF